MWGDDFHKKFQILEKKISFFFTFNFSMLLLLHLKRQSEHSGLRPDTSSLVVILWISLLICSKSNAVLIDCYFFAVMSIVLIHCLLLRFSIFLKVKVKLFSLSLDPLSLVCKWLLSDPFDVSFCIFLRFWYSPHGFL